VGWGHEDGRRLDPGDCRKRGKFNTLPRMMSQGPIILGTIVSQLWTLYIHGAISLVPFVGYMAQC